MARLPHASMAHQRRVPLRVTSRKIQPHRAAGQVLSRRGSAEVSTSAAERAAAQRGRAGGGPS
ncbi:MAG TPA: hypothetical protein VNQ54_11740, partial [Methylomirabilota bacterium]|nr:hypothetical protein [Methylomirabilota bacterium]